MGKVENIFGRDMAAHFLTLEKLVLGVLKEGLISSNFAKRAKRNDYKESWELSDPNIVYLALGGTPYAKYWDSFKMQYYFNGGPEGKFGGKSGPPNILLLVDHTNPKLKHKVVSDPREV